MSDLFWLTSPTRIRTGVATILIKAIRDEIEAEVARKRASAVIV